jgi:hypothetical protein
MIDIRLSDDAPHLTVKLEGTVEAASVHAFVEDLSSELQALPEEFVALLVCSDSAYLEAEALGPLFYLIAYGAESDPRLAVVVADPNGPAARLRDFLRKVLPGERVRVVPSAEEARRVMHGYDAGRVADDGHREDGLRS